MQNGLWSSIAERLLSWDLKNKTKKKRLKQETIFYLAAMTKSLLRSQLAAGAQGSQPLFVYAALESISREVELSSLHAQSSREHPIPLFFTWNHVWRKLYYCVMFNRKENLPKGYWGIFGLSCQWHIKVTASLSAKFGMKDFHTPHPLSDVRTAVRVVDECFTLFPVLFDISWIRLLC